MKIDCSETLNYAKELLRLCDTTRKTNRMAGFSACTGCVMLNKECNLVSSIDQERIDIVQKWSDGNPQETMAEHFFKLFPNAPHDTDWSGYTCPYRLGWISKEEYDNCRGRKCEDCWNRPYTED